jgi:hypothetical protein
VTAGRLRTLMISSQLFNEQEPERLSGGSFAKEEPRKWLSLFPPWVQ